MLLKKLKPRTAGTRHQIVVNKKILAKSCKIIKKKIKHIKFQAGRSSQTGHITSWHRGGYKKKLFRFLNINKNNSIYLNITNFYDPNRNCFVSLKYNFIEKKFELALSTNQSCSGALLESGETESFKYGCFLRLDRIPVGSQIHSITNKTCKKIMYTKSAGTTSQILQKSKNAVKIKLASGQIITTIPSTFASIGQSSNSAFSARMLGKAGKNRVIGKRPIVRGVAMNPVDHPHGGQTSGGRPSVSPWGKLTKGVPTKKK